MSDCKTFQLSESNDCSSSDNDDVDDTNDDNNNVDNKRRKSTNSNFLYSSTLIKVRNTNAL